MLKKRLIGGIVVKNNIAVQSIGFHRYLPLGDPAIFAENFNRWGVDEILLIDISAAKYGKGPNIDLVRRVACKCFVPLTIGGGIRNVEDVYSVIAAGGDKIAINTAAYADPTLLRKISDRFGRQSVVASIDVDLGDNGQYLVRASRACGTKDVMALARLFEAEGAGELLITSVSHDGSKIGFDINLLKLVDQVTNTPIIVMGGAGCPRHLKEAFEIPSVSGAAAANFFAYREHSVIISKGYLKKNGILLRIDTNADYSSNEFSFDGWPLNKADSISSAELISAKDS